MTALAANAIGKTKRVADLFCGLGTFTFALTRKAAVTAIEQDRTLLAALEAAARRARGIKPVETIPRDLMREPLSFMELKAFGAAVFDPPRAGALAQAQALVRSGVPLVVAVSCNPATFARDARALIDGGYRLKRVAPVDQSLQIIGANRLGEPVLDKCGVHQARNHGVTADALSRVGDGCRLCKSKQPELGCRISDVGTIGAHAQAGNRGDVDDRSLALALHHWDCVFAAKECRLQVVIDLCIPNFFAHGDSTARCRTADIVDEYVDGSNLVFNSRDSRLNFIFVRDIEPVTMRSKTRVGIGSNSLIDLFLQFLDLGL